MKALVAIKTPESEFSWSTPGELLWENPIVCCSSVTCGCNRALSGVESLKSTTTAQVVQMEAAMTEQDIEDLADRIGEKSGFGKEIVLPCLKGAIEAAQQFEPGTIVTTQFEMVDEENGYWNYQAVS